MNKLDNRLQQTLIAKSITREYDPSNTFIYFFLMCHLGKGIMSKEEMKLRRM